MFKGKSIYIRAVRDIAEGTAITLSYVDMTLSTIQRKNLLKVFELYRQSTGLCARAPGVKKRFP